MSWPIVLLAIFMIGLLMHSASFYYVGPVSLVHGLAVGLLGVLTVVVAIVRAIRQRTGAAIAVLGISVCIWVLWFVTPTRELGLHVRYWMEKSDYDFAVSQLQNGNDLECLLLKQCQVDEGPPKRIVFSWGGIVDNWLGVIHDPSHEVTDIDGHKGLFGGDLVGCRHLSEDYYLCSFT